MARMTGLKVFREVVEARSFAAAAARLSISAPMATKHVAQLERDLGARLLNRSSRHLSLTEAGSEYYEQCRQALDLLDAAEAAISQRASAPRGQLRVSAPGWCATPRFAQALADYRGRYPEVLVEIQLQNRFVDLVAEGFDLALRARADQLALPPTLIARRLCEVRFEVVATSDWLARHPVDVEAGEDLSVEAIVPTYVDLNTMQLRASEERAPADGTSAPARARDTSSRRRPAGIRLHPIAALRCDDSALICHAARTGMAAALLPRWLIDDDMAAHRLVPVIPGYSLTIGLYAVYTSRQYMPPKLRTFIDFFGEVLSD